MARSNALLVRVGVGALVVIAAVVSVVTMFGDTETDLVLRNKTGPCEITGKETEVTVKNGKKVTWKIKNKCRESDKDEIVTVGNFRTTEESTRENCEQATQGTGVTWPFEEDETVENRSGKAKIKLKLKKVPDLSRELAYYFDVCSASGGKSDPRLLIEP
jgi:hypothetical protein